MRQIIYVKYNRTRSEKFQLKTAIVRENGALSVEKTALTEAGAGHMGSFWEKYQMIREQNPRIRFLEPEFKDGGKTVCFRYLEGETLADALADRIHMGQIPYEELERDGFLENVPGKGCFVAPQNRELLREAQLRRVEEKLTQAIEEARRGAVSLEELKEMLTELYQEV